MAYLAAASDVAPFVIPTECAPCVVPVGSVCACAALCALGEDGYLSSRVCVTVMANKER